MWQPTLTADRGWLHLETRTTTRTSKRDRRGSATISVAAEKLEWEFTPMLGGVIWQHDWHRTGLQVFVHLLEVRAFKARASFVFDVGTSEGSFFYSWSELSVSPVGLVSIWPGRPANAGPTRPTSNIQRGLLVGFLL